MAPSRRRVAPLLVLLASAVLAGSCGDGLRGLRARWRAPRVVLVTFDTLHVHYTGLFNPEATWTPALDALAADGVLFERAYTPVPTTLPAHASLLTGREASELGVMLNGHSVPESAETLAEILSRAGYDTAAFVSLGVLDWEFNLDQGFSFYDDRGLKEHHRWYLFADEVFERAAAWVREAGDRPFFLWLHLSDPHEPYQVKESPPDARLTLDGEPVGEVNLGSKELAWLRFTLEPGRHRLVWRSLRPPRDDDLPETSLRIQFLKTWGLQPWLADEAFDPDAEHDLAEPLEIELVNPGERPEEVFHFVTGRLAEPPPSMVWENYPREVEWADRHLGKLRALLAELGLEDDTLWMVTSDHGEGLYNHRILGHSDFGQEDQLRVVWLMNGPGVPRGRRLAEPEALMEDFLPTVLELLGLPSPPEVTGRSRVACWREEGCAPRDEWWSFGARLEDNALTAVAGFRWPYKALWQPDPGSGCYRLDGDPWERNNLCKAYTLDPASMPPEVAALEAAMERRRRDFERRLGRIGRSRLDPEQLEILRSLGYVGN